ncbi:hypothetical protein ACJX0J_037187, partial [Zea mays]
LNHKAIFALSHVSLPFKSYLYIIFHNMEQEIYFGQNKFSKYITGYNPNFSLMYTTYQTHLRNKMGPLLCHNYSS